MAAASSPGSHLRIAGVSRLFSVLTLASALGTAIVTWEFTARSPTASAQSGRSDEYLYLYSQFDVDGFATKTTRTDGNFSGATDSLDPSGLPTERRLQVSSDRWGKITFLRPKLEDGEKNLLSLSGQTIRIRTRKTFNVLFSVGTAKQNGSDWITFHFEDGTKARGPIGFSTLTGTAQYGEEIAFSLPYRTSSRTSSTRTAKLWLQRTPIPSNKRIVAITLPDLSSSSARVFALTLANRSGVAIAERVALPTPEPAPVAIFAEPGFPPYKASVSISAADLQRALADAGVRASLVGIDHLVDAKLFTAENFPVYVHLGGKAYPAAAADNIRAYRKSGGRMVHTGVAFDHSTTRAAYGGWDDSSTSDWVGYDDEEAMGASDSAGVAEGTPLTPGEALRELGLYDLPWKDFRLLDDYAQSKSLTTEGLNPKAYDGGNEVVPLLTFEGTDRHFAALVRNKTGEFAGAIDVWAGTAPFAPPKGGRLSTEFQASFLTRMVALALREGNDSPEITEIFARATEPFDPNRVGKTLPPPTIAKLEPESTEPSEPPVVHVLPINGLSSGDRILMASAQGLLHQREDGRRLFLQANPADENWISQLEAQGLIAETRQVSLGDALDFVGHRRAVVVAPGLRGSLNLATMIGALEGLLVALPDQVETHKLEVAFDLRGLFQNATEMLEWTYEHIWPRVEKDRVAIYPPGVRPNAYALRDFLISERYLVLWVPIWEEKNGARSSPTRELEIVERILGEAHALTTIVGSAGNGSTLGLGNSLANRLFARYGKHFLRLGDRSGLSLSSKLRPAPAARPAVAPRDLKPSPGKIYVAVIDEPGVALPQPVIASVSLAGPLSAVPHGVVAPSRYERVFPSFYKLIAEGASGNAVLGERLDVLSGADFGLAYGSDRTPLLDALDTQNGQSAERYRFIVTNEVPASSAKLARASAGRPVFITSGSKSPFDAHELVDGVPVFHSVPNSTLLEILTPNQGERDSYDRSSPLFLFATTNQLAAISSNNAITEIRSGAQFVRPDELALLYKKQRAVRSPSRQSILAAGSTWRYHDRGEDLGTSWRLPQYNDSSWSRGRGEFGYGDSKETTTLNYGTDSSNKHPCYYFRKTFDVTEKGSLALLFVEYVCDDGVVVYLNGEEVERRNMPSGDIAYSTTANSTVSSSGETRWNLAAVEARHLRLGKNTIAVQLHQASASSSDLGFDLRISGFGWGPASAESADPQPDSQPDEAPEKAGDGETAEPSDEESADSSSGASAAAGDRQ